MPCVLLIDDRERAIIAELNRATAENPPNQTLWKVMRLTNGDFLLCSSEGFVLAMIERKTYSDLAQSIKDGRIDNLANLIDLNARTRVALLLEGARPEGEVNGIPVHCLRAKINHLFIRDNVHIIETADTRATAQYLLDLARDSASLERPEHSLSVGTATKRREPPSIQDMVLGMFAQFPHIGKSRALKIIKAGISIEDYVNARNLPVSLMRRAQLYTGAQNIVEWDVVILARVQGISVECARAIILGDNGAGCSLREMCALSPPQLARIIPRGRMIMRALGCRIYDCLHFRAQEQKDESKE